VDIEGTSIICSMAASSTEQSRRIMIIDEVSFRRELLNKQDVIHRVKKFPAQLVNPFSLPDSLLITRTSQPVTVFPVTDVAHVAMSPVLPRQRLIT
jgi:hypothetical protein